MADDSRLAHDGAIPAPTSIDQERALAGSAHRLQRAAGMVQGHSGDAAAVPTHAIALAHVEEALDRLAVAMGQMANAVAEWSGERGAVVDERALPPEARALRCHLRATAHRLRESEVACTVSREAARRLHVVSAGSDAPVVS